jgi:hypothetical protein
MISNRYKLPGYLFILTGIVLTTIYSLHRVDISMPVFAVYSSFLLTKYFTVIKTNIFEELILISFLGGFLLTAFSRERTEHEYYSVIRGKAWHLAILVNSALLIFSTIFVFGRGFLMVLVINLFSTFILYHLIFFFKKRKFDRLKE